MRFPTESLKKDRENGPSTGIAGGPTVRVGKDDWGEDEPPTKKLLFSLGFGTAASWLLSPCVLKFSIPLWIAIPIVAVVGIAAGLLYRKKDKKSPGLKQDKKESR